MSGNVLGRGERSVGEGSYWGNVSLIDMINMCPGGEIVEMENRLE